MKTTIWIGMLLTATLLVSGCGKTPPAEAPEPRVVDEALPAPQEAAPPLPMGGEAPAATAPAPGGEAVEGAEVAAPSGEMETRERAVTEESSTRSEGKPTVLKAVGRSLLKSFTSGPEQEERSSAPAFRPDR